MKPAELRELTVDELQAREKELREEIFQSRLKFLGGELNNTSKMKHDRRDLARVVTILAQKKTKAGA
jgi:large subunit ribosomal protein L29